MTEPKLLEIKSITVKASMDNKKFETILINVNYRAPLLFNPEFEKLVVVVNGKETELKL